MTCMILDGKAVSIAAEETFKQRALVLEKLSGGKKPILATILVGADPASATYVRMKGEACKRVAIEPLKIELAESTTTSELMSKIKELNENTNVHGILLQHPVPGHIDERLCFDSIDTSKDVDGVTTHGFGRMAMKEKAYGSATPAGIMRLLSHYKLDIAGKLAVVVGRSPILGKPMAMMLLNADATVITCHSKTQNLAALIGQAEILVGAVGRPHFIQSDWIKDDAVVVDAGYHPGGIGDVCLDGIEHRVKAYTPVPGGVGPMTINTLIMQAIEAAEKKAGIN
jgi:methylenetetrahydrofolate dehydrogenase (NADP+)/methenyltetrahydrofolate cyclohydrolase